MVITDLKPFQVCEDLAGEAVEDCKALVDSQIEETYNFITNPDNFIQELCVELMGLCESV